MIILSVSCGNTWGKRGMDSIGPCLCAPGLNGPELEGSSSVAKSVAICESKWCQITGNFNLT